jgi:hypothetical protein
MKMEHRKRKKEYRKREKRHAERHERHERKHERRLKHESRSSYERHRKTHTHEREKHLYRDGAKRKELKKFEHEYGKKKGKEYYGAVVGKVYREKYGHSYRGGRHPEGREGHEHSRTREHRWR